MTLKFKPLFLRRVDVKIHKKLDAEHKKTGVPKWIIAEKIFAEHFKIKVNK